MRVEPHALKAVPPRHAQRTIMAAIVQFFVSFGVKQGLDPDELCELAGFSPEQIAYGDLHVPHAWLWTIRQAIIDRLPGDIPIGLELGQFSSLDQFGYLGHALKYSGTPLTMLGLFVTGARFADSIARELPPRLIVDAHQVRLEAPGQQFDPPECVEGIFTGLVASIRLLSEERIVPVAVQFSRPRQRFARAFEDYFGCVVEFGHPVDAIVFDRASLDRPYRAGDGAAGQRFFEQFERRIAAAGDPFASAVRSAVQSLVDSQMISQARLAKLLGLSVRSLQRRLKERELRYGQLVTDVRQGSAKRLLEQPAHSIADVASALGYDLSSFTRAFRGWTGMSPSAYRKTQVHKDG